MKALTIQQPWAWAITVAGKTTENRGANIVGNHRGDLAIHAGLTVDPDGLDDHRIRMARRLANQLAPVPELERRPYTQLGAVLAVARVAHVHVQPADSGLRCCEDPWADRTPGAVHIGLTDVRRLERPVPASGMQGMWETDTNRRARPGQYAGPELTAAILEQVAGTA